ncbi:hypothetical protein H2200_010679 [Cladophialophora chaetospira]|uniref:Peptidase S9 prolyl oligopeptidase catalytic domain-containing protein n=1 Tax=Cladophialophora chaetospira TaxID=386627 RepID=A0AA39CDR9_9EURO|nr:hypothetical protein H2200_010679 [Cladophialophora chaetospira]
MMRFWCWHKLLLVVCIWCTVPTFAHDFQQPLSGEGLRPAEPLGFQRQWDVLGPFRIGTREAVWGADPIERYGGIRHVKPAAEGTFHSPLTRNATVQWTRLSCNTSSYSNGSSVELNLDFNEVDWDFAQKIYGWSAFQYQAWVKGGILNQDAFVRKVALFTDNILELWVNDMHIFGGDFFDFGDAPVMIDLRPGTNEINLRLIREVRSMGGASPPTIQASVRVELASRPLEVLDNSIILPDVVKGRLCSRYGSVTVRNQIDRWITVRQLIAVSDGEIVGVMYQETLLAPGQSRQLKLTFDDAAKVNQSLDFALTYSASGTKLQKMIFAAQLEHSGSSLLHKITFLHPGGAVSYAMLRPPPVSATSSQGRVPVLMALHGAGVEASGFLARHSFDDALDLPAWLLIPTGMSQWSGDDWHTWGFLDAGAAAAAIPVWIRDNHWKGPDVKLNKILVAGHSNGGQGTWHFASHQPDSILGAVVASGYSSIETYVPYVMWNEGDALQSAILSIARSSFRHEVLVENLADVPISQQHGSSDDNVPAYHCRLMKSLLAQSGQVTQYSEIPNQGHWFEGVMTTIPLMSFYTGLLNISHHSIIAPESFTVVVPNSHGMGSKYSFVVDQLSTPDRMGRVLITIDEQSSSSRWHLRTENIHRFHFDPTVQIDNPPHQIFIDDLPHSFDAVGKVQSFVKAANGVWGIEVALEWKHLDRRYGRQRGALEAILRSSGPFEVVYDSNNTLPMAVQTSRNFLQYFGADTNIVPISQYEDALERGGNVITICLGASVPGARLPRHPIHLARTQIMITARDGKTVGLPLKQGMGAVWLRPLPNERLELVVWGHDEIGLRQATRLIPTLTGAGVPDFVILSNDARWKGHGGAVAMGFFDHNWKISAASYLP